MSKINKINVKTFQKEVNNYQNRIFYSNRGKSIQIAASAFEYDLTPEQVAYIHAVMVVSDNDCVDYGQGYVDIPVELLFTLMTPFSVQCYKNKNIQAYMSGITTRCLELLTLVVFYKEKQKGQCRRFAMVTKFAQEYHKARVKLSNQREQAKTDDYNFFVKGDRSESFSPIGRVNKTTVKAVDKLRESTFVFDADYYYTPEGKAFIHKNILDPKTGEINTYADNAIGTALSQMYISSNKPQYHNKIHLQDSGRVHTVGGCIQLPKWFRNKFILPVDSNNIRIEFDLKCAQLLILSELLGEHNLRAKILNILDTDKSIWTKIGRASIDKKVKKIIVYSFCFGADLNNIPFLASKEAKKFNIGIPITKELVKDCFTGLLEPLMEAREEWLKKYTTKDILNNKSPKLIPNALGNKFSLTKKAIDYYGDIFSTRKENSTKVGSQLLAHLCQGQEQYLIQNLIANNVEHNILTWAYDGFVLEVPADQVNLVIENLVANSEAPIEYEIISS